MPEDQNNIPKAEVKSAAPEATKTVIKPTVGRVVWYNYDDIDERKPHGVQPYAAIITYVNSDTSVNLVVFGHDGVPFSKTDVTLADDTNPGDCQWMPYQKGQAAKTEALEKAAAEAKTG